MKKVIIVAAPSGCGKSTVVRELMNNHPSLKFSISATTRKPRGAEVDGKHYYYKTQEEFEELKKNDEFVEWQEVYPGLEYGTLKSEVSRIWDSGGDIIFDVDVKGGSNLKKYFGDSALLILLTPPNLDILRERLIARGEDSQEDIDMRLGKAKDELLWALDCKDFDYTLQNVDLGQTLGEAEMLASRHLAQEFKYLFLDIDGVLNHSDWYWSKREPLPGELDAFDPKCVKRVNEILAQTGAFLVISSSWRMDTLLGDIFVKVGLPRIFDKTPFLLNDYDVDDYSDCVRGVEIERYLAKHPASNYCIVDDYDDFLDNQKDHIVLTSTKDGLNEEIKDKIINILNYGRR